jgi:glycosyltransferase involved in cell wall biosynthesis
MTIKNVSKIRIGFFISNLQQGGAEKQFVELIKGIDKNKFQVYLYLYAYQKEVFYKDIFEHSGIKVETNKLENKGIFKIIEALIYLRKITMKNKFDILFSSLFMNNLFLRLVSPKEYNNKIVTTMRTSLANYSNLYIYAEKFFIPKSYIIFNSKKSLTEFKSILKLTYHFRLHLIYNGFESIKTKTKTKNDMIVFGSLGRFSKEKNILQSVRVFQFFFNSNKLFKLIIQGHFGNQFDDIKEIISTKNIEIRQKNSNVEIFYNSIDVLILPSVFEGCPNVLFEAMLRKKICIVSKGANSDKFVENGVTGFIYDGSDIELINTINYVISLIGTKKEIEIVSNAHHYASSKFSMQSMVKNYELFFNKLYEKNESCN